MKNYMFFTLAVFLWRLDLSLIFLVDSSLAIFWVSLKFEERSEDTANFPLTLNNFFTLCARLYKNSEWANILTFDFYPKTFHQNCRHGAIFDLNGFIFDILTTIQSYVAPRDYIAFGWLESHVPFPCPTSYTIYILLKFRSVFIVYDFAIANTTVSKQSYLCVSVCWDIINIQGEQQCFKNYFSVFKSSLHSV